jgi:undecaprenyl-diphosphatase
MVEFDTALFRAINNLSGQNAALDAVSVFLAVGLIFFIGAVVVVMGLHAFAKKASRWRQVENARDLAVFLRASLAGLGAVLDGLFLSLLFFRSRPFVTLPEVNLLIDPPLTIKSLPSDHTTVAFALAVSVFILHRRIGAVLLACAFGVGLGRILVGVHYPLDVLTGALLGSLWALVVALIARHMRDVDWVTKQLDKIHNNREFL